MLKFLLDEHISHRVADGLRRREMLALPISQWKNGEFLGRDDSACLAGAAEESLTLVTYDRRTIPLLLRAWADTGRDHAGVVFVDDKTIQPSQPGALVRALAQLYRQAKRWDWRNRVCFLQQEG
jgi:hypothetical protein